MNEYISQSNKCHRGNDKFTLEINSVEESINVTLEIEENSKLVFFDTLLVSDRNRFSRRNGTVGLTLNFGLKHI